MQVFFNNKKYQILTENGYKDFDGVGVSSKQKTINLYFQNGEFLRCTPDHKIKTGKGYIAASDIQLFKTKVCTNTKRGTRLIYKDDGPEIDVYDVLEVKDTHTFLVSSLFSTKNCLLLDEFAHVAENIANDFYASTYPTISSGKTTKIIMTSTPLGLNLFHKFWVEAQDKRNDFVPIFVHWSQVPDRDEKWKQDTIRNIGGADIFAQEYECLAGSTLITIKDTETGMIKLISVEELYDNL